MEFGLYTGIGRMLSPCLCRSSTTFATSPPPRYRPAYIHYLFNVLHLLQSQVRHFVESQVVHFVETAVLHVIEEAALSLAILLECL